MIKLSTVAVARVLFFKYTFMKQYLLMTEKKYTKRRNNNGL